MKLIVEMEMPKRCIECGVRLKCKRYVCGLQQDIAEDLNPLMGDMACLIKGVLPETHGRLIDEAVFCENVVKYSHQSTKTIGKALDATPTIIDMTPIVVAERKDDEQIY